MKSFTYIENFKSSIQTILRERKFRQYTKEMTYLQEQEFANENGYFIVYGYYHIKGKNLSSMSSFSHFLFYNPFQQNFNFLYLGQSSTTSVEKPHFFHENTKVNIEKHFQKNFIKLDEKELSDFIDKNTDPFLRKDLEYHEVKGKALKFFRENFLKSHNKKILADHLDKNLPVLHQKVKLKKI